MPPDLTAVDAALSCLDAAWAALDRGDVAKAERLVARAMKLAPSDDARRLAAAVRARAASSRGGTGPSASSGGGAAPPDGVRQRRATAPDAPSSRPPPTPDQVATVATVLQAGSDYYRVLGLERGAGEAEVKKAYRRLALRLHPDKNAAPRASDAFKLAARAFACLSDPSKRRVYDAGGGDPDHRPAGRPAPQQHRGGGGGFYGGGYGGGPFGPFGDADFFDAEDIFNAFFGFPTGGGGGGVRFRTHGGPFGGHAPPRRARGQAAPPPPPPSWATLLAQLAPLLLLVLFALLPSGSEPPASLDPGGGYTTRLATASARVPFYVASAPDFGARYPAGGRDRLRVETSIEAAYRDRLERACYGERVVAARAARGSLFGRGQKEPPPMPACEELVTRFHGGGGQQGYGG